jgi:glycosyltransferase involved in cell wall biosynthesis
MSYKSSSISLIQISPYPPESGSEYHKILVEELSKMFRFVFILAGLSHLINRRDAEKTFGSIEKYGTVIVIRSFWAPRLIECRHPLKVMKYAIASVRNMVYIIKKLQEHSSRTIVHFHYGLTTWPGVLLGEHYVLGMLFARFLTKAKVVWTIHAFLLPSQVYEIINSKVKSRILAFLAVLYYIFLAKLAALVCHKIIVLTMSNNAPVVKYFSSMFGKQKVIEMVHPLFRVEYEYKPIKRERRGITIVALGYIRAEKNYETLFHALYKLRQIDLDAYRKMRVIVAGVIERQRPGDVEYLTRLQRLCQELGLDNVEFKIKRLTSWEWHEMLSESDMVWCAYNRRYGPSGIYAWALTYNKVPIIMRSYTWEGLHIQGIALDRDKAVDELIKLFRCQNMIDVAIDAGSRAPSLTEHVRSLIQNYMELEPE